MRPGLFSGRCLLAILFFLIPGTSFAAAPSQGDIGSDPGNGERLLCASELQGNTASENGYIGVFANETRSGCEIFPAPFTFFYVWIWCLPSVRGIQAAEFAVDFSEWVLDIAEMQNPNLIPSLGTLGSGISVVFGEGQCQRDWVWTHKVTCMVPGEGVPGYIGIVPHPGTLPLPACQYATCETGFPIEPFIILQDLYVDQWCTMCPPPQLPKLTEVIIESTAAIRAVFDQCVWPTAPSGLFVLYNKADSLDSILVTQAMLVAENEYDLTLAHPMTDGTTYVLYQRSYVWSCSEGYYSNSQWEFTFLTSIATLLQSCSAAASGSGIELAWELSEVDAGIEFFVSRSENGTDFAPLDMAGLKRTGLQYSYTDARVEPGKRYVYRVEYAIDGKGRLLFISEEIRMPAALLALEQNRPNPFNPSTTISFTLPAECAVRLDVYDVSGRLVARLIDGGRRGAGAHDVKWNGRDASGKNAASGIYIYRLTAGKETIARKMALLR